MQNIESMRNSKGCRADALLHIKCRNIERSELDCLTRTHKRKKCTQEF